MSKGKILFLTENLSYGGAQKMLAYVASELAQRDFEIVIYIQNNVAEKFQPIAESVEVITGTLRNRRIVRRFQEVVDLKKIVRKTKPDIIVSFLNNPNLESTICSLLTGVPNIICERGDPSMMSSFVNKSIRKFEATSNGAVFQTKGAAEFYPAKLQKKACIIPNPVVPPCISRKFEYRDKIIQIASVGRFEVRQKRQDLLIEAFSKIAKDYCDIHLNFYGSGPDEARCKYHVNQLGLSNRVTFWGKVSNPSEYLLDNDVYVLSSDYEGIPNSLIEAMALGVPAISTDCSPGGARALISSGNNGLIVPRADATEMANAIKLLIDNPSFAKRIGLEGKKIAQDYSSERIIDMWDKYITSVMVR